MTKTDYTIAAGILELSSGDTIRLNSPQWWEWLESAEAVAFTFDCDHGIKNYRARKETVKGKSGKFWYAYKRHEGTLRKRYIGKSEELSLEKLEAIAYDLLTPPKSREVKPELPTQLGNDVGEYREMLNDSRRIAIQRESDFDRLMAQKVQVCRENQELKHQLELLHTQVGNNNQEAQLRAELEAANEQITQLKALAEGRGKDRDSIANLLAREREKHSTEMQDALDAIAKLKAGDTTGESDYTAARCYSAGQIALKVVEEVIHDKSWRTSIERHRQDPKTSVRYWALVKLVDELRGY
jgi:hypothetical protein